MNQQYHVPGLSRALEENDSLADSFSKIETLVKEAVLHISEQLGYLTIGKEC